MRVLNVIPTIDSTAGGTVECIRQLYPFVASQQHTWEVVTFDAPDADFVIDCPFPVHALGQGQTPYEYHPRLTPWLKQNRVNYDIAIIHGIWTYHSFGAWRALHGKLPYLVYPHGMLDPYFKRAFPLKHLKKLLFWHWSDYRVLRDASAVCFTCEEEMVLARQSFSRYKCREKVVGLGTACPPTQNNAQVNSFINAFPPLANSRYLLFMSRIHPKKGLDLLIGAMGQLNREQLWPADLKMVLAGPDSVNLRHDLEMMAEAEKVSHLLVWTGMLQGEVKWDALRGAEAFVLPSHQENFGIVVAEALACGTPVLISNKVNIWREIKASESGFVEPDTLPGIVALLRSWMEAPHAQKVKMRENSTRCFSDNFEISQAAQKLLNVAQEVLDNPLQKLRSS